MGKLQRLASRKYAELVLKWEDDPARGEYLRLAAHSQRNPVPWGWRRHEGWVAAAHGRASPAVFVQNAWGGGVGGLLADWLYPTM